MKNNVARVLKIFLYLFTGVLIILSSIFIFDSFVNYINYIVGISLVVGSTSSLVFDIRKKRYEHDENHIASHFMLIVFGLIILLSKPVLNKVDLELVCTLWGVAVIINSCLRLDLSVYEIFNKEVHILETIEAFAEIVLGILLILHPESHVKFHIILLGIEFILESSAQLLHILGDRRLNILQDNYKD